MSGSEAGAAALTAIGDLEHALLGEVDELGDGSALVAMRARRDVAADLDELPQHRVLAHDARVGADVRGARRLLDEPRQVVEAAGRLEAALGARGAR